MMGTKTSYSRKFSERFMYSICEMFNDKCLKNITNER